MGSRMAKNLIKGGYKLVVYNRSKPATEEMAKEGALVAASPAEMARQCEIVILSLPSSAAVEETVLGERGLVHGLSPGGIVVDTSTIDPAVAVRVEAELSRRGHHFLDAPVSGGPEGASAGTLAIMVGGDRSAFERSSAVLQKMGANVFYLGESGSGLKVKLFNQALVGVYFVAVAEAYAWSTKMGLKLEDLENVITKSWGDSPVFRHFLSVVGSGNLRGGAAVRNIKKDLSIIIESADREKAPMSLAKLADRYISGASRLGYDDFDVSVLYTLLDTLESP
jgi:2-hydroxy-3-oxopropionate reductase